ncbi:MAG: hypothetical protein E7483_07290, partial [Ruminococcaceae bacterium]|nr:hypothetical protein [Oscillospiraceae bacterium]
MFYFSRIYTRNFCQCFHIYIAIFIIVQCSCPFYHSAALHSKHQPCRKSAVIKAVCEMTVYKIANQLFKRSFQPFFTLNCKLIFFCIFNAVQHCVPHSVKTFQSAINLSPLLCSFYIFFYSAIIQNGFYAAVHSFCAVLQCGKYSAAHCDKLCFFFPQCFFSFGKCYKLHFICLGKYKLC